MIIHTGHNLPPLFLILFPPCYLHISFFFLGILQLMKKSIYLAILRALIILHHFTPREHMPDYVAACSWELRVWVQSRQNCLFFYREACLAT